ASFTEEPLPLGASLREPLREKPVRQFLLFVSVMMLALGCMAPFLAVHSMEFLRLGKAQTSLLTIVAPLLGIMLTSRFWGDIIGRNGNRPVLRFCSMFLIFVPVGWLLATPHTWVVLAVLLFVSGSLFCAVELCNQNLISGLSPHLSRGTISALFSICAGSSFALGSFGGGQIAQMLQGREWHFLGMTFVNYHILFFVSLVGRLVSAFVLAPHLQEPTAVPTREMLRETVQETVPELARQTVQLVVNPPLLSPSSRHDIRKKRQLRQLRKHGRRRKHAAQYHADKL
ncbi:MAG TPA: MFS transporter, partial [Abditibacteriaceae bacterium]|nr:MFS transporter [Abditibacteriaceae bacterium]